MKITRNQCYLLTHIVFFGFYVVDGTGVQPIVQSRAIRSFIRVD